jgi:hypothetical protein
MDEFAVTKATGDCFVSAADTVSLILGSDIRQQIFFEVGGQIEGSFFTQNFTYCLVSPV